MTATEEIWFLFSILPSLILELPISSDKGEASIMSLRLTKSHIFIKTLNYVMHLLMPLQRIQYSIYRYCNDNCSLRDQTFLFIHITYFVDIVFTTPVDTWRIERYIWYGVHAMISVLFSLMTYDQFFSYTIILIFWIHQQSHHLASHKPLQTIKVVRWWTSVHLKNSYQVHTLDILYPYLPITSIPIIVIRSFNHLTLVCQHSVWYYKKRIWALSIKCWYRIL